MNYVCIEEDKVIGVFNYQPEVPESVTVVEVTDEEHQQILSGTHYFDIPELTVKSRPQSELEAEATKKEIEIENMRKREFLSGSDWQVMRHIRQKALGLDTTLSEEQYLELENQRQNSANSIINP